MAGDNKMGLDGANNPSTPPRYRAIVLGPVGEVMGMVRLEADDDPSALFQAEALVDGHAVELWDGVRYIHHFPPVDRSVACVSQRTGCNDGNGRRARDALLYNLIQK